MPPDQSSGDSLRTLLEDVEHHKKELRLDEAIEAIAAWWDRHPNAKARKRIACVYAWCLRKERRYQEAIGILESCFNGPPKYGRERREYYWNIYHAFVRGSDDLSAVVEQAESLIRACPRRDFYSPFHLTCLEVARKCKEHGDHAATIVWCLRADPLALNDGSFFTDRRGRRREYSSLRERYYETLSRAYWEESRYDECAFSCIYALRHCDRWKGKWMFLDRLVRSVSKSHGGLSGGPLLNVLLEKAGFRELQVRSRYLFVLVRGREETLREWSFLDNSPEFRSLPEGYDFRALYHAGAAVRKLVDEIYTKTQKRHPLRIGPGRITRVTDLADYAFCPAAFAIKQTYWTEDTEAIDQGRHLHTGEQRGRRIRIRDSIGVGFCRRDTEEPAGFPIPKTIEASIQPYLDEIAGSRLIFHDDGHQSRRAFTSKDGMLRGLPDYLFERPDGTRFLVEEKYTEESWYRHEYDIEYANHRVQVAAYLHAFPVLELTFGYLFYWIYRLERNKKRQLEEVLTECRVFRIEKNATTSEEVRRIHAAVARFKVRREEKHTTLGLNPHKCVNCSVSTFCYHKTGIPDPITIPYRLPEHVMFR